MVVTSQVTFEQIRRERPQAAKLLSLMSFFQAQNIPESVLHAYDDAESGEEVGNRRSGEDADADTDDVDTLETSRTTLVYYGAIRSLLQQRQGSTRCTL